jgi:hypothetical protein
MNLTNPLDGAVPSSALLAQLDRSILLLSGVSAA